MVFVVSFEHFMTFRRTVKEKPQRTEQNSHTLVESYRLHVSLAENGLLNSGIPCALPVINGGLTSVHWKLQRQPHD